MFIPPKWCGLGNAVERRKTAKYEQEDARALVWEHTMPMLQCLTYGFGGIKIYFNKTKGSN